MLILNTKLKVYVGNYGDLMPIEFKDLPFNPQRIFIIKNVPPGSIRGNHAHFETVQFLICLKGKIQVNLHDGTKETIRIIEEAESILIDKLIWNSQVFIAEDSILLVFCSTPYLYEDYIIDFEQFKAIQKDIHHLT